MNLRLDRIKNRHFRRFIVLMCVPYALVRHVIYASKMMWDNLKSDFMAAWRGKEE